MHFAVLWSHILLIIVNYADGGGSICTFNANLLRWSLSSCSTSDVLVKAKIKRWEERIKKKKKGQIFPEQITIARHFEAIKIFLIETQRLELTHKPTF